ncbi:MULTISPECIES: RNA polymerase sporulation sigma factor SigF [Halobacillus]|uniref:RNA polymerase sigma factor SigF n=1 Tax=Halobacillus halophilus (strain ATCC 35676 / DSM 2266 / JCM 20832 / KCTC 3685 / LMG 17431 / NBRC 102448 / NCIMB 2269) TaxID=866895 RepID=I0JNH5_HALH3|nr:RNA polymerase sporulation sigma factor SigF [Halobacillus halophilus]ASF39754.1 RNA polymerase sporulation sigma factor SigF [Halobacillus halophilus]CCG45695.1 RNA polymerase sigma factor SigF [Halobacillus halophilus DSM 2266]
MSDTTKERLSDHNVKELIRRSQAGDQDARDFLVEKNTRLVWSVVQRYLRRGYDQDDLYQIGCIGLLKSIDKFDLSYDVRFSTYAVPMIIGEIQRFIRDDGTVKVSRSLKELNHKVRGKKEELMKVYGRSPTVNELAEALGMTREEIVQAEEVGRSPQSIYETVYENEGDPITLVDQIAEEEDNWFEQITLQDVLSRLEKRERLIIYLRYYKDQTQTEVAERLGISQVQVSRLEKKILADMKQTMNDTS